MIKKRARIVLASIIVLIILLGAFYFSISTKTIHRISALDAKKIADNKALEIDKNLRAYSVVGIGKYSDTGECEGWMFKYRSDSNSSKRVVIKVWWNGNTESYEDNFSTVASFITNWTIDSTEAVKIAKSVEDVDAYLSKYRNALIERIAIVGENNRTDGCMINIQWIDWGVMDDPHWAKIQIDATTGEVLYVEADLSDGSSYLICFVPVVIIISILLAVLLTTSKRFPNFFIATGFALFLIPTLYLRIYYSTSIFTFMTLIFAAVLWLGTKRRMSSTDLNMECQQVYGLFGLLAADYFCLIIARFLLLPYSYPTLL